MSEATASILVWISISGFVVSLHAAIGATGFWILSNRKVNHAAASAVQASSAGQQRLSVPAGQMSHLTASTTPAPPGEPAVVICKQPCRYNVRPEINLRPARRQKGAKEVIASFSANGLKDPQDLDVQAARWRLRINLKRLPNRTSTASG